jgi:hypothetical protein
MRLLKFFALLATLTVAAAAAQGALGGWGPETPHFNLEAILRPTAAGPDQGFGHVKFRQPNDNARIIYLDTWVRDLVAGDYLLQRQVDTDPDGDCSDAASLSPWVTLGGVSTDDRGSGRAALSRDLDPPGPAPGPPAGMQFDIHFRLVDATTSVPVLESACYQFTVSL